MTSARRAVLIYNPVSGHGHLDSWNALFVALLLERGWRVLALTPDPVALSQRLEQKGLAASRNLQILDWNSDRHRLVNSLRDLWKRWDKFGDLYFYRRPGSEASADLPFLEIWKRRFFQATVPFLFRLSYFIYTRYLRLRTRNNGQETSDTRQDYGDCPLVMSQRVVRALGKARWSPAVAFNMYMDTYSRSPSRWSEFGRVNNLRWAGIRFVPPAEAEDPWYGVPLWRGACVLDEEVCRSYSQALPDKCFEYLPDITEAALPERQSAITQEIVRRANGRRIVFLGGSIGGQKNLARWIELIDLADPQKWFFVQLGEIHRNTLTADDIAALDKTLAAPPDNLLLHPEYLADEKVFNEAINVSDVIFAVYRDFRISSNLLGKAAHFRKPILVSDRYLLGQRVRQYGIGCAVDEDDAASILSGLVTAISHPPSEEGFSRYRADFSAKELVHRLENFLQKCSK
ncbi:glycosyltransferase [Rhizobium sp. SGZ-381]|uniref:glycosyltransferase n=1 Tax=Rhizobium sp. SGZ-381 TaxID=3342800 RepID=UPI00366FE4E3